MKLLDVLHQKDVSAFFWIQQYQSSLLHLCREISRSADGLLYVIIPLLYWSVSDVAGWVFCKTVALAFAIERPVYYALKTSCRRSRPMRALPGCRSYIETSDEFSFPSGHTCCAFLFVTLCTLLLSPVFAVLYTWAVMVGLSRIVLGVHFPTDVVVGALMGVLIGVWTVFG